MTMTQIIIGRKTISPDSPPYIIAEAGVHHGNSVAVAREYILQAHLAGADAIKFQTYSAARIVTTWAPTYWDDPVYEKQFDVFAERSRLSADDYAALFAYAAELGITLLSTPFDPDSAAMLANFDMAAYKIASADLTHFPLLEAVAAYDKPVLLSTGAATFAEIDRTVAFLDQLGATFALLHCVLSYPTPVADANLRRIAALRERYPRHVIGYSDHVQPQDSPLACPLAVALGARIIEKHFTLNKNALGDDHYHAVDPPGLRQLVADCRDAFAMTLPATEMKSAEAPARQFARRSVVAAHDLPAGTVIEPNHVDFKRPGTGVSPADAALLFGRKLRTTKQADDLILFSDLEDA